MATLKKPLVNLWGRTWPREMLTFINSRQAQKDPDVKKLAETLAQPGVYVLFNMNVPHYAGKAISLRKRLLSHTRMGARYATGWDHFSFFVIPDADHRNAVESIVIASIGNTANSAKPRIKKVPMPSKAFVRWQRQQQNDRK